VSKTIAGHYKNIFTLVLGRSVGHAHDLVKGTQSHRQRTAENQSALGRRRFIPRSAENRRRPIAAYHIQTLVAVRTRTEGHGTVGRVPRIRPDREPVHSQRFRDGRPQIRPFHYQSGAGPTRRQFHHYSSGNVFPSCIQSERTRWTTIVYFIRATCHWEKRFSLRGGCPTKVARTR